MEDNFDRCMAFVLEQEGGFVNNPNDPGGATNMGITKAALGNYLGRNVSVREVQDMHRSTAVSIYKRGYWIHEIPSLPAGFDLFMFDWGVNAGPRRAIKEAWSALNGRYATPFLRLDAVRAMRDLFYKGRPKYPVFGRGWDARTMRATVAATKMIHEATGLEQ